MVLRLALIVAGVSSLVVLAGGSALWLIEGEQPDSTLRSWGDALWWSLTTMTTVGYGDHVPVTTTGRLIAAGVMVVGVAVIGAVAAIVALAVAHRVAQEEELAFEAEAETLEQRLEVRLDRIEAQLAGLDARLQACRRPQSMMPYTADETRSSGGASACATPRATRLLPLRAPYRVSPSSVVTAPFGLPATRPAPNPGRGRSGPRI